MAPLRATPSAAAGTGFWHSICFHPGVHSREVGNLLRLLPGARAGAIAFTPDRSTTMSLLKWAFLFLVLAGIAGLLGFSGIAAGAEDISKVLFMIFLVVFAVIGILAVTAFKTVT
jgi:uncharacterized membrane protein YtjA (UPF0391 family)